MTLQAIELPDAALPPEDRRRLLLCAAARPEELSVSQRAMVARTLAGPGDDPQGLLRELELLLALPLPVTPDEMAQRARRIGRLLAALVPYPPARPDIQVDGLPPSHVRVIGPGR